MVFTIMENQSDTEWDYEGKHPCLFCIPSRFCFFFNTIMENRDILRKPLMSIQHSIIRFNRFVVFTIMGK